MAKIIRTSDLRGLILQETPHPKNKPITSSALAKLTIVEERVPDLSKVILPRRKIEEKLIDTHKVEEFNAKYKRIIAEEKAKLDEEKFKKTLKEFKKEEKASIVKKITQKEDADFTRAIEVKETPKKKRQTRKKKNEK
jgi:hypothetical protein